MKLGPAALRIYDLVQTCPDFTLTELLHELGEQRRGAADRAIHRMAASGVLVRIVGDDDVPRYRVNPDAAPDVAPVQRKPRRRRGIYPPAQLEAKRSYAQARRDRAREEGRCLWCLAGIPERWRRVLCPECCERRRESHRRLRATKRGMEIANEAAKARYQRYKSEGRCMSCGGQRAEGSRFCTECRLYQLDYQREWKRQRAAKGAA